VNRGRKWKREYGKVECERELDRNKGKGGEQINGRKYKQQRMRFPLLISRVITQIAK
jgi:hypothetical protein